MDQHSERCGDDLLDDECAICRDEVSPEFIERMKAAAAEPGITMTGDEARAWLRSL